MNHRSSPCHLRAFVRADLLAVLVGVAMVVSLLTGAVRPGRARTTACLANLRLLANAMALYAEDSRGYYPGNIDDGSSGRNWVAGNVDVYGAGFTNAAILADSGSSLLSRYLNRLPAVFRCPANPLSRRVAGEAIPQARNYSLNGAVGTNPYMTAKTAVDGPWLDGVHGHIVGRSWQTFAGPAFVTNPSGLFTFLDEEPYSVNDGAFAMSMAGAEWLDWPATHHEGGGTFAFADLHVDHHRWKDSRTKIVGGTVGPRLVPDSPDHFWLQQRTSALIRR